MPLVAVDPTVQMWLSFAVILGAVMLYASEKLSMEITSLGVVTSLVLLFHFLPSINPATGLALSTRELVAGFADPALVTVLALLVIGQGLVQTGSLDEAANIMLKLGRRRSSLVIIGALAFVLLLSAILNNTPVVVMFIPILSALSQKIGRPASRVLLPLSFAAILGGNLTIIGSSTNLLVSGEMVDVIGEGLDFFTITVPGSVLAGVGFLYLIFVAPKLLDRYTDASKSKQDEPVGKQFIFQIEVKPSSGLDGLEARAGMFPSLKDITVRMILRGSQSILPPFEDLELGVGDILVVAATRNAFTGLLKKSPEMFESLRGQGEAGGASAQLQNKQKLAEVVVAPASRMVSRTLAQIGFYLQTNCIVLGVERRSRMIRSSIETIRLEAGDVLLVAGRDEDILGLRSNRDLLLLEWSAVDFPSRRNSTKALALFGAVVASASTGFIPIPVAALTGAVLMVAGGCINVRQAARAADRRIFLLIGAALAMGTALTATGGAQFLADGILVLLEGASPAVVLSAFFLLVAVLTNVLSNNATAVLFTPIAISIARGLDLDPMVFVVAVIFAANSSFATPMGYQTNLLVMGPGHYKFRDFLIVGIPLSLLIWIVFSIFAPWYYGLW
ncbi:MAG: SLC13 family permease [Sphingomonadales bacterium]